MVVAAHGLCAHIPQHPYIEVQILSEPTPEPTAVQSTPPVPSPPIVGFYPDGSGAHRWFDGISWTDVFANPGPNNLTLTPAPAPTSEPVSVRPPFRLPLMAQVGVFLFGAAVVALLILGWFRG
jgi:hypothetical protein